MREIKFRAWDKDMKKLRTVRQLDWGMMRPLVGLTILAKDGAQIGTRLHPEEYILMQFTGLHDKNGKEIYEGDVVKCDWLYIDQEGNGRRKNGVVKNVLWDDYDTGFQPFTGESRCENVEVIGNIYENPELLS